MSIKKKIAALLTAALFVIPSIGLTACGGSDGDNGGVNPPASDVGDNGDNGDEDSQKPTVDTFKGAVSQEKYDNIEDTAKAYFEDELLGKYIGFEEGDALTTEQIASLELADAQNVQSATVIEISYMNTMFGEDEESESERGVRTSAATDNKRKHKAYAVKYKDNSYKYFSPLPEVGEALTRSYYLSLIDSAKYTNCTVEILKEEEDAGESIPEGGTIADMIFVPFFETENTTIKIGGGAIEEISDWQRYDNEDENNRVLIRSDQTISYITMRNDTAYSASVTSYEKDGEMEESEYCSKYNGGETNKEEWADIVFDVILGYTGMDMFEEAFTYMDKTETGFKSNDIVFDYISSDGTPVEKYWNFDVENGRIVKVDMYMDWDEDELGFSVSNKFVAELTDFGATASVEIPQRYSDMIDEYIETHQPIAPQPQPGVSEEEWMAALDTEAFKNCTIEMLITVESSPANIIMTMQIDYYNKIFQVSYNSGDSAYTAKIGDKYYSVERSANGWSKTELEDFTDQSFDKLIESRLPYFSFFIYRYGDFQLDGNTYYKEVLSDGNYEYKDIRLVFNEGKVSYLELKSRAMSLDDPNNDYQSTEIYVYDYGKTQIQLPEVSE